MLTFKNRVAVVIGLLGLCGLAWNGMAAFTVAEDGASACVIVSNGHEKPARELRKYLNKITGADIDIVANPGDAGGHAAIVLEIVGPIEGLSNDPKAEQGYRIRTEENRLSMVSPTRRGLLNGVYGLLTDHLDVRFYTTAFEVVPERADLTLPAIDDVQEPGFRMRGQVSHTWVREDLISEWYDKMRGGGLPRRSFVSDHSFFRYINPDVYFDDHPEWFAMNRYGKRHAHRGGHGLCGTDEELARVFGQNIVDRYDNPDDEPARRFLRIGQGDGFNACQCDKCRALVEREGTEAAPYIKLLNGALEHATQTFPNLQVCTFAYFATLTAPKTLIPHDNLWINIVSSSLSLNQSGDQLNEIVGTPANRYYERAIREWPKIAPGRVTVWHWDGVDPGNSEYSEWPNLFAHADDIKFWYAAGVAGAHGAGGPNWGPLKRYVWYSLKWNPRQDVEALVMDFLEGYYGPKAAPILWEYLVYVDTVRRESNFGPTTVRWYGWGPIMVDKIFTRERRQRMDALMNAAMEAAAAEDDPVYLEHVRIAGASSVDQLFLSASRSEPFNFVVCEESGDEWFVQGSDPSMPARIERVAARRAIGPHYPPELRRTAVISTLGGPVERIESGVFNVAVVPWLDGRIVSLKHKPTGKELLAVDNEGKEFLPAWRIRAGYRDIVQGWTKVWEAGNSTDTLVSTVTKIHPREWGSGYGNLVFHRTVSVEDGDAMRIGRNYRQPELRPRVMTMPDPCRFNVEWPLAIPVPSLAAVGINGGGIAKVVSLAGIDPLGPTPVTRERAAERLALDAQNPLYDEMMEHPVEEEMVFPVTEHEGEMTIHLSRGDGLTVEIRTEAAGWDSITLRPDVEKETLLIVLTGIANPMGRDALDITFPAQTVRVREVEAREIAAAKPVEQKRIEPRIRITGEGTAVNEIDGAELVWIPEGSFLRGSEPGVGGSDEWPRREIHLDGYWIYKYPVTLGQYKKFIEAIGREMPPMPWGQSMMLKGELGVKAGLDAGLPEDEYPALMSWVEAREYLEWAVAALPTEAQWEKAARGTDGREYPWGDEWLPDNAVGMERTLERFRRGMLPVGASPGGASPYGVEDMAGNAWEWVYDWYDHNYYANAPAENPTGPDSGTSRVLRGGDSQFSEDWSRSAARFLCPPDVRNWVKTGFRGVIMP